jgi:DNA-binding transcriptional LysR family regulator
MTPRTPRSGGTVPTGPRRTGPPRTGPGQTDPERTGIASRVTLSQLRTFVAVVENGTYSEAALTLGTAQSTLSHAINELERTLGQRLLERGRHGATPTVFGQTILEHAHDALNALEALEQVAQLEREGLRGTLRIASMRSAATHILPAVIGGFRVLHPKIRFELIEEEAHPNGVEALIREARADLGIMNLALLTSDLLTHELFVDEYMLLWPDDGRLKAPTWAEIAERPLIEDRTSCWRVTSDHWRRHGQTLEPAFSAEQDSAIISMVAHGLGVSIMPSLAYHPLPRGVLAFPLPDRLERRIGVVATRSKAATPVVRAFVQALREYRLPTD